MEQTGGPGENNDSVDSVPNNKQKEIRKMSFIVSLLTWFI
jgi:hypothetical protein